MIVQLSDTLYLNLDAVTIVRWDEGAWLVFFQDHEHACRLTEDESTVLARYLHTPIAERAVYSAWRRRQQETTP